MGESAWMVGERIDVLVQMVMVRRIVLKVRYIAAVYV
jgi:hypothetical protein